MTHSRGDTVMPGTASVGANNSEQELLSKYHTPLWKGRKGGAPTKGKEGHPLNLGSPEGPEERTGKGESSSGAGATQACSNI